VGFGVFVGFEVLVTSGAWVGLGVLVDPGVWVGVGVRVGFGDWPGVGVFEALRVGEAVTVGVRVGVIGRGVRVTT
jgi:UDP-3-O-[3-hydroxymyristoyl] glucosamine N-acyltransferase